MTTASVGHLQIRCNTRSDLRTCGPLVDSPATHAPAFDSRSLVDSPATHAQASRFQILRRTHRLHTPGPSIHDRSADSLATHAQTSGLTVPRSLTIFWTSGPLVPQSFTSDLLDLRTLSPSVLHNRNFPISNLQADSLRYPYLISGHLRDPSLAVGLSLLTAGSTRTITKYSR